MSYIVEFISFESVGKILRNAGENGVLEYLEFIIPDSTGDVVYRKWAVNYETDSYVLLKSMPLIRRGGLGALLLFLLR